MSEAGHTVRVPATTANLGPGFDSLGIAVRKHLVVQARPRGDHRVITAGDDNGEFSTGDDNLIWQSLTLFCEHVGRPVPDLSLFVSSEIPSQRGLGSSSAAIVAGLTLGRATLGHPIGDREIVRLATQIEGHPDNVAPAVLGGFVVCAPDDRGETVVRRANPAAHLRPVVFIPAGRQATGESRTELAAQMESRAMVVQAARASHIAGGMVGAWQLSPALAGDVFHEPPRLEALPATRSLLQVARAEGLSAWLSGSGPSVAAMVAGTRLPREVDRVAAELGFSVAWLDVDLAGALACPDGGCAVAGGGSCVQCPRNAV